MKRCGWWAVPGALWLASGRPLYGRCRWPRRLRVALEHLLRHLLIVGSSGSGKSRLLRLIIVFCIRHGISLTVIDPAGDLHKELLATIADLALPDDPSPEDVAQLGHKLVLIEPELTYGCVGINLLEQLPGQVAYLVVDSILEVIKQLWAEAGSYGPRLESIARAGLRLLMEHGLSLLEMIPLLSSASFRDALVQRSKDRELKMYFREHLGDLRAAELKTWLESSRNKFEALGAHPTVRRLIGQTTSTVTFRDIIDGKWCFVNLSADKFKQSRGIIGALFISLLHNAILSRENEPPERRTLHLLVVDEAAEFWQPAFVRILTGSRKHALGAVISLQNLTQPPMSDQPEIIDTILSNTHTRLAFACGRRDADRLAREFFLPTGSVPQFQPQLFGIPLAPARTFWSLSEEIESCAQQLCHQRVGEAFVSFKGTRDPRPFACRVPHVADIDVRACEEKVDLLRRSVAATYNRSTAEIDADIEARWQRWQLPRSDDSTSRDYTK